MNIIKNVCTNARNIFILDSFFHLKNKVGSTFMRITGRRIALFIVYDEYFTYIWFTYCGPSFMA